MICGTCKREKPNEDFTKLNISKDGTHGLCKECKSLRDLKHNNKVRALDAELPYFDFKPDLLIRKTPRIGVLNLIKFTDRKKTKGIASIDMLNMGLRAILKELKEPYEYCDARYMNDYQVILISLTSVMDIENLIYTFEAFAPKDVKPQIIVGGFGVMNINLIKPYIDIACFGRGEGQINDIITGKRFDNVWRKEDDPNLQGKYKIRQMQYLVDGECAIGCRNRCKFCQYTFVRRSANRDELYHHGKGTATIESDWNSLNVDKPGRFTSAWDGWSDDTRHKVSKPITNQTITDKLIDFGTRDIHGGINLKIFQIVGYPWETPDSVLNDIRKTREMFEYIDSRISNDIVLSFLNTPFAPEPMTPMQYESANIYVSWQNILQSRHIYNGKHLRAVLLPYISGPFSLLKRIFIHRATEDQLDIFKSILFSGRLRHMSDENKVAWLLKYKVIDAGMFGNINSAPFDYLMCD
jgi:hypothetical protein